MTANECAYWALVDTSRCVRGLKPGSDYCSKHEPVSVVIACSIIECGNETGRFGQPCDPCDKELGAG